LEEVQEYVETGGSRNESMEEGIVVAPESMDVIQEQIFEPEPPSQPPIQKENPGDPTNKGSITISPNRQIIKRVEHSCQSQDQILEEVQEFEETGGRFKINEYYYNFNYESMKQNKYYVCNKMNSQKCRGSITISPNGQIIKKVEHTCQCQDQILEEMHEYEEIGRSFKINGYYYHLKKESMKKNKYYACSKKDSKKCRGSITISPNRHIIKRVEHSCQSQNQILEEVQEFEETGGRFKINGYFYNFYYESMNKNKYYTCNKWLGAKKCRGSITISPNSDVLKKVDHTCKLIPS